MKIDGIRCKLLNKNQQLQMKINEHRWENGTEIKRQFDKFRNDVSRKKIVFGKMCKHGNHYIHAVE